MQIIKLHDSSLHLFPQSKNLPDLSDEKAEIDIAYLEVNQDVLKRSFHHSSLSQDFSDP